MIDEATEFGARVARRLREETVLAVGLGQALNQDRRPDRIGQSSHLLLRGRQSAAI
ncbi:MAG: hypothetical protein JO130_07785 [Solirubrobacterales bacterium]|nr:hypothetical protein [Solirubrobacterales bacterium]